MTQDIEVIQEVLRGNIESFSFLIERYERPVVRIVRNMGGDKGFCEDVAQDVFFTAYKKLSIFDSARSSFSTWIFTIAKNKAINALKKKKPLSMSKLPEKTDTQKPADDIECREFYDELDKQLQALPERQKRAFILAEFENLPYEQIAQIEGVRIGTVKSRINRAKNKLRSALKTSMEK